MAFDHYSTSTSNFNEITTPVIYIVDNEEYERIALRKLLRSVGWQVEIFDSSEQFLAFPKSYSPSCLVLDVRLRGQSGMILQQEITKRGLNIPVIFTTRHGDIQMSVKAMKAGALDFLTKPYRDQDILDAVARAIECDAARLAAKRSTEELYRRYSTLRAREREVLGYVVSGMLNKSIASEMEVSEDTVKLHRGHVMKKMAATSLADLVRKATALNVRPLVQGHQFGNYVPGAKGEHDSQRRRTAPAPGVGSNIAEYVRQPRQS
jgi:FixJ family two-component response regulator